MQPKRLLIAAAAGVCAAAGVHAGSSPASAGKCVRPVGSRLLEANSRFVVWREVAPYRDVVLCNRQSNLRIPIASGDDRLFPGTLRLAGPYYAFARFTPPENDNLGTHFVVISRFILRGGVLLNRALNPVSAALRSDGTYVLAGCVDESTRDRDALPTIQRRRCQRPGRPVRVDAVDADGEAHVIARGSDIDPRSVRLSRAGFSYIAGGEQRLITEAQLAGPDF